MFCRCNQAVFIALVYYWTTITGMRTTVRKIASVVSRHRFYCKPLYVRDINTTPSRLPGINYQNVLVLDVDNQYRSVSLIDIGTDTTLPPLVIIPGTAQTAATFSPHLRQIAKTRRLIIPEIRSQGRTELLSEYCTIDQHVDDFFRIIVDHMGIQKVHLAGFSFGGRVSLAIAGTDRITSLTPFLPFPPPLYYPPCNLSFKTTLSYKPNYKRNRQVEPLPSHNTLSGDIPSHNPLSSSPSTQINTAHYPQHVERLSITGVPYVRPPLGTLILQSWKEGLIDGHLRNTAWSFILNGYSSEFIDKNHDKLDSYVDMVVEANDVRKLADLLVYGHVTRNEDLYSIPSCAARIQSIPTQIIGATQDRIAGIHSVRELHHNIPGSTFHELNTGHLAPFENTAEWRKLVLDFMATDSN